MWASTPALHSVRHPGAEARHARLFLGVCSSRSSEVRDFRGRLQLCVFFSHDLTLSLPSESMVDATPGFQM